MSKKLCKGIRKDGHPCQGNGLHQFDGYCIAHAPSDITREWRARGGRNSSTAARLDKRMPEELRQAHELILECMILVKEGKMSPAVFNAICRGIQTQIALRRRSDEEMDDIRTEEIEAAAAEYLGVINNLDVLEAADEIKDQQDQYRLESLVDQGYASYETPSDPDEPAQAVLNDKGRRHFGYQRADNIQLFLKEATLEISQFDCRESNIDDLPEILDLLETMDRDAKETLSKLGRRDVAPLDPLTGHTITELPAGVRVSTALREFRRSDEKPQEVLQEQRRDIRRLKRLIEDLREDEDYKHRWEEREKHRKLLDDTEAFLAANGHPIKYPPTKSGWK